VNLFFSKYKDERQVYWQLPILIASNFAGRLFIQEAITEKKLIQISITKAKTYDMVKNKLKNKLLNDFWK
jgi:hypothetical protein